LQQLLTEIQLTLTRGQVVLIIFVTFYKSCIQSVKEGIKQLKDTVLEQFGVDFFFAEILSSSKL